MFHAPAGADEFRGQRIEQFRMRGWNAELPEVVWRAYEAFAEVILPDAVDHHARGERIVGAGDPARELEPSAAGLDDRMAPDQQRRHGARNGFTKLIVA